ncbi:C4-dicarboxylate transporter DctA [Sphingobacterium thalpophilum]|uniref:Aerobic C4-dicarboxylate transport protein n=1 Tax=Sphingobacterium thalpophilum TaxID=259 RepID=A0A4U9UID8_9SPHI|nr:MULTISPECIES: C4-dicarboxylate transporter DctA [Sphingobacterium]MCW8313587.1 C4-dicarboxylate transporter DctA [Sphingobacterium sp. InxBP1]VTR29091.1 Aerobic C4-dicarboxylate transport protein [Sphingobacterium thalpophilum]
MKHIFKSLYFQVIVGILVGIFFGAFFPDFAVKLKPLGDAFIKLIKMVIAPLIFSSIVIGIAGMKDVKKVGKIGLTSIIYFEIMTTVALIIGLVFVNIIEPGRGMNADPASLDISSVSHYIAESKKPHTFMDFVIGIIPDNVIASVASDNLLQVLVFAVLFGVGMTKIGQKASEPIINVLQSFLKVLFSIIKMVMYLAPIGAMGAMGFTIGAFGIKALTKLGMLMLSFYLTCIIFIVIVIGAVLHFYVKVNIFKFLKYIKGEILIVLGTSSSESALPGIMQKMEEAGCAKSVVGLVIPTGYSFNLDGTSIYLTMAAVFISQALNMHLSLEQEITLLLVLLLTSKGAAGVTGSGFVTLAATLPVVGHVPMESVALVFGVDRFMSEARAITNLIGNSAATLVISKYEDSLDEQLLHEKLG